MRRNLSLPLLLALLIGAASPLLAQGPPVQTATLLAVVYDRETSKPVEGVNITIPALGLGTLTTPVGQARLASIPAGRQEVEVGMLGYETQRFTLDFEAGDVERLEVVLETAPVALEGVEVTAERQVRSLADAGFYQRQRMGFGSHLDRAEIQRRASGGAEMSSVFRGVSGVRVQMSRSGMGHYLQSSRAGQRCNMEIFVDGARVGGLGEGVDIDRLVRAQDVEAVEVYGGPSEVPIQYRSQRSSCGAVLIWTRTGP